MGLLFAWSSHGAVVESTDFSGNLRLNPGCFVPPVGDAGTNFQLQLGQPMGLFSSQRAKARAQFWGDCFLPASAFRYDEPQKYHSWQESLGQHHPTTKAARAVLWDCRVCGLWVSTPCGEPSVSLCCSPPLLLGRELSTA